MMRRGSFRLARTIRRIGSTRRIVATGLAGLFFACYILSGVFILATREPANPVRLRLWLCGGMTIYLVYHLVRCVWSAKVADLELTDAESLWLGSAPIQRSSLVAYHVSNVVIESVLKALLLTVVLARDVEHIELLVVGLVASLVLLQIGRLILQRLIAGLGERQHAWARFFATAVAGVLMFQVFARLVASTPFGSPIPRYVGQTFAAMGQTAASDVIQWISLPWWPASRLIVTQQYDLVTVVWLSATLAVIPAVLMLLIHVDAWVLASRLRQEQQRLEESEFRTAPEPRGARTVSHLFRDHIWLERWIPKSMTEVAALIHRQVLTAGRYRTAILLSFIVPTLLCLSPFATGQINQHWLFVVGGVALCTVLLAPPALPIDFRRDLKRMVLLRSLPISPSKMVLGQLAIPVLVTLIFQWFTILVAAAVVRPGWSPTLMWMGMLNALAVITFAAENSIFLTFPHHQYRQGVLMMIRAKMVFLGKVTALITALAMLLLWIRLCSSHVAESIAGPALVLGPIIGSWSIAIASVWVAKGCWQRFDLERDIPPQ